MAATDVTCVCGKKRIFSTESEAWEFIHNVNRSGNIARPLTSVVECREKIGVWHVTSAVSSKISKLRMLQEELHMATIRNLVIEYIESKYNRTKKHKCSTSEIKDWMIKNHPMYGKDTVASTVFKLKKEGVITELDEFVPGGGGRAKYFTLTSILDEITKPKEVSKTMSKITVPEQAPKTPVPVNPFDKVNAQLGELVTKINGLIKGYTEISRKLDSSQVAIEESDLLPLMVRLDKLTEIASSHVTVDGDKLADVINARLQNLKLEDSFIYKVREEVMTGYEHVVNQIPVPPTVANSEDYQSGIIAGIKLAVEMGLRID